MQGYRLGKTAGGKEIILVDNFDDFITFNNNFKTDGSIYILGNKKMEFRINGGTYIEFANCLIITETYIQNKKNKFKK